MIQVFFREAVPSSDAAKCPASERVFYWSLTCCLIFERHTPFYIVKGDIMFKGWLAIVIVMSVVLGSLALIKSANAVCEHEFMHVSICSYIPNY